MIEQELLDSWKKKYIGHDETYLVDFIEYKDLEGTTIGRIYYIQLGKKKVGRIYLDYKLKEMHPIFAKSVLWHEFVHYWNWVEDGEKGHGMKFQRKKFKKKVYWLMDVVVKFVGIGIFD